MEKVKCTRSKIGFIYSGKILSEVLRDGERGELIQNEEVWTNRDPATIPESTKSEYENRRVMLESESGSRVVDVYILGVMIMGGATVGDLQQRFIQEGMCRSDALIKSFREYPKAHADYLRASEYKAKKEAEKKCRQNRP